MSLVRTVAFAASAAAMLFAGAANAAGFYEGKVVTVIVPNTPAGEHTRYVRMISPYVAKYLGARDLRIDNQPGAGSLRGTNVLWNAKPDGMTVGFTGLSTLVFAQLAGSTGVQFDSAKFTYLGNVNNVPRALLVGAKSPIKTIEDVKKLDRPFIFPTQGTDDDFYAMAVLFHALGKELKTVTGYQGDSDTNLAVIKGDGDGHMTTWQNTAHALQSGEKRGILTIDEKRWHEYPDVPTVTEIITDPAKQGPVRNIIDIFSVTRGYFGPPGMDPKVVEEFRAAVKKALEDPALQAEAKQRGFTLEYIEGGEVQKRIARSIGAGDVLTPILKAALQSIK